MNPGFGQPIFVVGCYRSGTTMFARKLARHPDLATVTQTSKKFPGSVALTRLLMRFRDEKQNFDPTDGSTIWDRFRTGDDDVMGRGDATPQVRAWYDKVIRNHLAVFGKSRFMSKFPSNSLRLEFLDELFPGASYVHVVRDGRAVVSSMLRGRRKKGLDYNGARVPGWRELGERPEAESAALQWLRTVEHVRASAGRLSHRRLMVVRYEDFVEDPAAALREVGETCRLDWPGAVLADLGADLESRNHTWRDQLTAGEVRAVNTVAGELLAGLGYPA